MLSGLQAMEFDVITPSQRWQAAILQLASAYRLTFYAASYHALAMVNDGIFVTADEKYMARAGAAGHIARLHEWSAAYAG